jgi:hypothetical protein
MVRSRQGLIVSIKELRELADDLEGEARQNNLEIDAIYNKNTKWQINIINEEECSDTWKIEKQCHYELDAVSEDSA